MLEKSTEIALRNESQPIVNQVNDLVIKDTESQRAASELLILIKTGLKKVKEKMDPICKASNDAHKGNTGLRNELTEPFTHAENILKQKLARYLNEQAEKQRFAQIEAEATARAEEQKKQEAIMRKAEKAEAKGDTEKAMELHMEAAMVTVAPEIIAGPEKVPGVHKSEIWGFEITDIKAVPREYMIVNEVSLNGLAKATKGAINLPGIKFVSRTVVSARAKVQTPAAVQQISF